MDRVLIVIDNVQFSGHLENTLRKIGYDTDTLQNEYNLAERVLSFNPDIIIVRGTSHRLSTLNVGRRLKDNVKFNGKVILVFPPRGTPSTQMSKLKVDLVLEEPASAFQIAVNVLNLEQMDKATMRGKLYKMLQDDAVFRHEEQSYLIQYGLTVDDEPQRIKEVAESADSGTDLVQIRAKILDEMRNQAVTPSAKIESYNKQIEKIDVDLKKGLSKRKTKEENKENRKQWEIPASQEAQELDAARKEFTNELFKKS